MKTKIFALPLTVTLIMLSLSFEVMGQSSPPTVHLSSTREYFLKNKLSSKLLDVRDGSKTPGAQIWQHDLNHSLAQRFRIILSSRYGNDAFTIRPQSSSLYLSLRHNLSTNVASGFASGVVVGELPTTVLGNPVINASEIDPNIFKLVQDRLYEITPIVSTVSPISSQPRYQIWKFVPVPNEQNTYFLESTAFTERMVLQPTSVISRSPLKLSRFNGSDMQKWVVLPTAPEPPSDLQLRNLVWRERQILWVTKGKVKGGLEWVDNSSNEVKFEIQMKRKDDGYFTQYWTLGEAPANSITFNFSHSGKKGKGREHCFRVIAHNRWGSSNPSNEACGIPVEEPAPPPPPPQTPAGVEAVAFYNCHGEQKSVRIWTYDHTSGSGQWQDRGKVASSWNGTSCPPNDTLVLKVPLTDGHSYSIRAIDCGDDPPNLTDGGCHRLYMPLVFGKFAGGIQLMVIN